MCVHVFMLYVCIYKYIYSYIYQNPLKYYNISVDKDMLLLLFLTEVKISKPHEYRAFIRRKLKDDGSLVSPNHTLLTQAGMPGCSPCWL